MPVTKNNKSKIVVVDDEQDMRSFLEILLRRNGYSAVSFPTAKRALDYCRANPFDLVITDLRMPEMDGVELLKERSEERRVGKECRSRWSPYQ